MIVEQLKELLRPTLRRHRPVRMVVHGCRLASLRGSDVLIASYPRSGNSWLRFLIATLLGAQPDFDSVHKLIPALGVHRNDRALEGAGGGRFIKTHERYFPGLPVRHPRSLIVVRDGRDVVISYYHHQRYLGAFDGTFDEFFDRFIAGDIDPYGPWHVHVSSWLNFAAQHPDDALVVRYEDFRSDTVGELARVAPFLGLSATSDELAAVVASNERKLMQQIEAKGPNMANRPARITFARPSQEGWAQVLSDEQIRAFNAEAAGCLSRMEYSLIR